MVVHTHSQAHDERAPRRRARRLLPVLALLALLTGVFGAMLPAGAVPDPGISGDDWDGVWDGSATWPPNAAWTDEFVPAANPDLAARCGIDLGIVIDRSGSIFDAGNADTYREAAKGLVDGFAGTPSKVGLWSFADFASDTDPDAYPWAQLTEVGGASGPANVAALKATIDSIPIETEFATNWEEGIRAPMQTSSLASPKPDLLIVLTDGQPTVHADDQGTGDTTNHDDLAGGIKSANAVKAWGGGTHILAAGVGGATENGLQLISGPDAFDGTNASTADFLTTSFDDLTTSLRAFATALCGGSVTVTKLASTPDAPDTFEPAPGWAFAGDIAGDDAPEVTVTPGSGITDDAGQVGFAWASADDQTITITETPQAGFTLLDVVCTDGDATVPTSPVTDGVTLTVGNTDDVHCTFRNQAAPVDPPTLDLQVLKDDGGFVAEVGNEVTYAITYANVGESDATGVVLTETVPPGSTFVDDGPGGWECIDDTCTYEIGDLPVGATGEVDFTVTVGPLAEGQTQLDNIVVIGDDGTHGPDVNPDDNVDEDDTPIKLIEITLLDPECDGDVPYLIYEIATTNLPDDVTANITFLNPEGDDFAFTDLPLSGRVLWPGAVVAADGTPVDWPGWTQQPDGTWVEGDEFDWVRPDVDVLFQVNPETTLTVTYPPATPTCDPNPPEVAPSVTPVADPPAPEVLGTTTLPRTGTDVGWIVRLAGVMALVGGLFLVAQAVADRRRHGSI